MRVSTFFCLRVIILFDDQTAIGIDAADGLIAQLDDLVKAGVVGIQHQLLGKEIDLAIVHSLNFINGGLHFGGTVGAVQILHGK